jgi:hypothetical protein
LALLAVQYGPDNEFGGVDPRRDDGPERAKIIKTLGAGPLRERGIPADDVGSRDVVDAGIAMDEGVGLIDRDAAARAPNDDGSSGSLTFNFAARA